MTLHDDWQHILRKSWSIRYLAIAAALTGAEVIVPMFESSMPRGVFGLLSFASTAAAFVARILVQPKDGL